MNTKKEKRLPLITPGEVLKEEFLVPLNLTPYRLAKDIETSATAIGQILAGTRAITPDMALRLSTYLGTTAKFWMNLQVNHDLKKAQIQSHKHRDITPYAKLQKTGGSIGT